MRYLRGRRATLRGCGVWKIPPRESGKAAGTGAAGRCVFDGVATAAGYDVRRRQGGRAQLAAVTGLSLTTISRTLDGKTLPLPSQLTTWATVLNLDHRRMLVESGLIPEQRGPQSVEKDVVVASVLSAQEAMDAWGITDPIIRKTLGGSITQAIQLQEELDAAGDWGVALWGSRGARTRGAPPPVTSVFRDRGNAVPGAVDGGVRGPGAGAPCAVAVVTGGSGHEGRHYSGPGGVHWSPLGQGLAPEGAAAPFTGCRSTRGCRSRRPVGERLPWR